MPIISNNTRSESVQIPAITISVYRDGENCIHCRIVTRSTLQPKIFNKSKICALKLLRAGKNREGATIVSR